MATFGLTQIGSSSNNFGAGFAMTMKQTSGVTAGTADSMQLFGKKQSGGSQNVKGLFYDISGVDATNLIGNSSDVVWDGTTSVWRTHTLTGAVAASTAYAIGLSNQTGTSITVFYDSTPGSGDRQVASMGNTPPDPWTNDGNTVGRVYSYYMIYTENVGGGTSGKSSPLSGPLGGPLCGPIG